MTSKISQTSESKIDVYIVEAIGCRNYLNALQANQNFIQQLSFKGRLKKCLHVQFPFD